MRNREMLLVADNLEQLLPRFTFLSEILRTAPRRTAVAYCADHADHLQE
jgi:hypothetical protein